MNDTQLALWSGQHLMPVMAVEQAIERHQAMIAFVQKVMVRGVDYGSVPGADKDVLMKAGAERLSTYFGLSPHFVLVEKEEDWTGLSHGGEPFFYYWFRCQLYRGELFIGEADGSCNSWETKYRYRQGERRCPTCGKSAIIKGKAEYGGGWLCFGKKGGCGAKFADGDPIIESQQVGRVPNPDPADVVNTVKKMSQKRALVAAVLIAVNASQFFTQDLEDLDGGITVDGEVTRRPAQPASAGQSGQTNGKCPVCGAAGNAHAPWCQDPAGDGRRIDMRGIPSRPSQQKIDPAAAPIDPDPETPAPAGSVHTHELDEARKQAKAQAAAASGTNGKATQEIAGASHESGQGDASKPKVKSATVKTAAWSTAAKALAAEEAYYTKAGQVDYFHMLGVAAKVGYPEITDANLAEVISELRVYAADQAALKTAEAEHIQPAAEPVDDLPF